MSVTCAIHRLSGSTGEVFDDTLDVDFAEGNFSPRRDQVLGG
jgi:hypothetical protein